MNRPSTDNLYIGELSSVCFPGLLLSFFGFVALGFGLFVTGGLWFCSSSNVTGRFAFESAVLTDLVLEHQNPLSENGCHLVCGFFCFCPVRALRADATREVLLELVAVYLLPHLVDEPSCLDVCFLRKGVEEEGVMRVPRIGLDGPVCGVVEFVFVSVICVLIESRSKFASVCWEVVYGGELVLLDLDLPTVVEGDIFLREEFFCRLVRVVPVDIANPVGYSGQIPFGLPI